MCARRIAHDYYTDIPILDKPFSELTSEEAEEYFCAFTGAIDSRVQYLEVTSELDLDYSADSLAEVWRWFLAVALTEEAPLPKKKKRKWWQKKKETEPPAEPPKNGGLRLTFDTECALWDISVYFGEVLVRNHPSLTWGYHTEAPFANMPILMGFEDRTADPPEKRWFEPFSMLREEAGRIFTNTQNEDDLYRLYREWESFAP